MALEVTLSSVAGALVALAFLGGLTWAWWHAARQVSGRRRVAGYVGGGAMGLIAVGVPAVVLGAPLSLVGVVLSASFAAIVVAGVADSVMDVLDHKAEREYLMSVGAPVLERRLPPIAAAMAVIVLAGIVGGMVTGALSMLWKALIAPQQTGSALLYQEQLAAAAGSLTIAASWATAWAALGGGVVSYLVQRWRVERAKVRLELAEERFEARLERERLEAVAAVLPSA